MSWTYEDSCNWQGKFEEVQSFSSALSWCLVSKFQKMCSILAMHNKNNYLGVRSGKDTTCSCIGETLFAMDTAGSSRYQNLGLPTNESYCQWLQLDEEKGQVCCSWQSCLMLLGLEDCNTSLMWQKGSCRMWCFSCKWGLALAQNFHDTPRPFFFILECQHRQYGIIY